MFLRIIIMFFAFFTSKNMLAATPINFCEQRHCVAVVDAGSTATRLHIYAYDLNYNQDPVNINHAYFKKIAPGIATIPFDNQQLNNYLIKLFKASPVHGIPVYFYATAGMRLLPAQQQQQYFESIKQWFATQSQWSLIDARIISGVEEGVFGWLAVNYETGSLSPDNNDKPLSGFMDIGGASVQIAFPIHNPERINQQDLIQFDLYGRHLSLFVHSFLGLGITETLHRFQDVPACFSNGYPMPKGQKGQGNALSCQQITAQQINAKFDVNHITQTAIKNSTAYNWYVLGAVSSLVKQPPMLFETEKFTSKSLLNKASKNVCSVNWKTLKNNYPQNDYLSSHCFAAAYYSGLVEKGYGLDPEQIIHCVPNTDNFDWTLGVVLHRP